MKIYVRLLASFGQEKNQFCSPVQSTRNSCDIKRSLVWFKVKSFWQVLKHLLYVNDLIIHFRQWRYLDCFVNVYHGHLNPNRFWNEKLLSSCSLRCYWNIFVNSTSINLRLYHSISRKKICFCSPFNLIVVYGKQLR